MSATFTYDGLGRQKSATTNGSLTDSFDGSMPVQESSGTTILANNLIAPTGGDFIARTASGSTSYFLNDVSRSTIALADVNGVVQTEYAYAPFGAVSSTGGLSSNPYQYKGTRNIASGLNVPTGGGGGGGFSDIIPFLPFLDPRSTTPLNDVPFYPSNWFPADPDAEKASRPQPPTPQPSGPESSRKSGGGGGPAGSVPEGPGGTGSGRKINKPGPMHGPFNDESEWSKRLDAHSRNLNSWKNWADRAVTGLGMGLDYLSAKTWVQGILDAFGVPTGPLDAATDILAIPTSPSDLTKVLGEMIYNGSSPTQAISTVAQDSSCFVCGWPFNR